MDSVLKQRIITAIFLFAAVVAGILLLPPVWFAIVVMVVFISIGGWEWSKLVGFEKYHQGLFIAWLLIACYFAYRLIDFRWAFLVAGILFWAIAFILLATYENGTNFYKNNKWLLRLSAFFVLVPSWIAMVALHEKNPQMVLYVIILVAMADTGAYFSGKSFGKNKLAPELSPGKTREGLFGGLIAAAMWAVVGAVYFDLPNRDWIYFVLLSIAVALISVSGDLLESLIKREAGRKDSGNILPGHGGILDRIDGLLAALPLFTLGVFWGAIQL